MAFSTPAPVPDRETAPPGTFPVRVAVAGARRVRAGTGPFLALHAASAGATVCGALTTRPESAALAREWFARQGLDLPVHHDLEELVSEGHPEALLISTPAGTHEPFLLAALEQGIHVLCEKPLLASPQTGRRGNGGPGATAERCRVIARAFQEKGLVLRETCQWPFTLEAFRKLHPGFSIRKASRFRMLLAPPPGDGHPRLVETLSHPLSLLQAVGPQHPSLSGIRFEEPRGARGPLHVFFCYSGSGLRFDCEVILAERREEPAPAEFSFDDRLCRRTIRQPGYRSFFDRGPEEGGEGTGEQTVPLEDPLRSRVKAFLDDVLFSRGAGRIGHNRLQPDLDRPMVERQALLEELLFAHAG